MKSKKAGRDPAFLSEPSSNWDVSEVIRVDVQQVVHRIKRRGDSADVIEVEVVGPSIGVGVGIRVDILYRVHNLVGTEKLVVVEVDKIENIDHIGEQNFVSEAEV